MHKLVLSALAVFVSAKSFSATNSAIDPATGDQAEFKQSIDAYKTRDFAKSRALLVDLTIRDPSNALYWFNLGNTEYMERNYPQAAIDFEKVVQLNGSLLPAAQLYWAKSLIAAGNIEDARSKLQSILNDDGMTPNLRQQAELTLAKLKVESDAAMTKERALKAYRKRKYKAAIKILNTIPGKEDADVQLLKGMALIKLGRTEDARLSLQRSVQLGKDSEVSVNAASLLEDLEQNSSPDHAYWAFVDLATGYDSNVYLDGSSIGPVSSAVVEGAVGFGDRYFKSGPLSAKLGYILNWIEILSTDQLRVVTQTVHAPLVYEDNGLTASVGPYYQHQIWVSNPALAKLGGRAKFNWSSPWMDGGVDMAYASQASLSSAYDYLNGITKQARGYVGLAQENTYFQIAYELGTDQIGNLNYTNGLLPLANSYSGPSALALWKASSAWTWSLSSSYLMRTYDTLSMPNAKARRDGELTGILKATWTLAPNLSIYALADFMTNSSTLGPRDIADKNIQDLRLIVGLTWDLL